MRRLRELRRVEQKADVRADALPVDRDLKVRGSRLRQVEVKMEERLVLPSQQRSGHVAKERPDALLGLERDLEGAGEVPVVDGPRPRDDFDAVDPQQVGVAPQAALISAQLAEGGWL